MTDKTPPNDQQSSKGNANKSTSQTNKQSDQGHGSQGGHGNQVNQGNQGGQGNQSGQGKQMEDTGSKIPGAKPPGKK